MIKPELNKTPRIFKLGEFTMKDHGKIIFESENNNTNEFFSLKTESGKECDIACTPWGFYLGPSLNSRLKNEGFRTALVVNKSNQIYVMALEKEKEDLFNDYIIKSECRVICWLDQWLESSVTKSQWESGDNNEK